MMLLSKTLCYFRGIPGMPGMEMYSREDIEKMRDQLGVQQKDDAQEEVLDSEGNLFHGEEVSFLQMIMDGLSKIWSWIKNLFGFRNSKSDEL